MVSRIQSLALMLLLVMLFSGVVFASASSQVAPNAGGPGTVTLSDLNRKLGLDTGQSAPAHSGQDTSSTLQSNSFDTLEFLLGVGGVIMPEFKFLEGLNMGLGGTDAINNHDWVKFFDSIPIPGAPSLIIPGTDLLNPTNPTITSHNLQASLVGALSSPSGSSSFESPLLPPPTSDTTISDDNQGSGIPALGNGAPPAPDWSSSAHPFLPPCV